MIVSCQSVTHNIYNLELFMFYRIELTHYGDACELGEHNAGVG